MQKIKVMIVEDDPFWQARLSDDLNREQDIEVVAVAANREEARNAAADNTVDVILVDINLSENRLDGLDVARDANQFVAVYWNHMETEEKDLMQTLRQQSSAEQLTELSAQMRKAVPPDVMTDFLFYMLRP